MLIKKQKARGKSFKFSVVFGNRLGLLKEALSPSAIYFTVRILLCPSRGELKIF